MYSILLKTRILSIFNTKLNLSIRGCSGSKNISKIGNFERNVEKLTQHLPFGHIRLKFFFFFSQSRH